MHDKYNPNHGSFKSYSGDSSFTLCRLIYLPGAILHANFLRVDTNTSDEEQNTQILKVVATLFGRTQEISDVSVIYL